jgi:hypothetical protein
LLNKGNFFNTWVLGWVLGVNTWVWVWDLGLGFFSYLGISSKYECRVELPSTQAIGLLIILLLMFTVECCEL